MKVRVGDKEHFVTREITEKQYTDHAEKFEVRTEPGQPVMGVPTTLRFVYFIGTEAEFDELFPAVPEKPTVIQPPQQEPAEQPDDEPDVFEVLARIERKVDKLCKRFGVR